MGGFFFVWWGRNKIYDKTEKLWIIRDAGNSKIKSDEIKSKTMWVSEKVKVMKLNINGGNIIKVINIHAASIVKYAAKILVWTKEDLQAKNRKTREIMTMQDRLNPRQDAAWLYVKRGRRQRLYKRMSKLGTKVQKKGWSSQIGTALHWCL